MTKQVHTSIEDSYARKAALYEIGWADALRAGIDILSGIDNDEKKIRDKIENRKMEITVLEKELAKIDEKKKKEAKEKEKEYTIIEL